MITAEAVEEFSSHFDKVDLENRLLEMEGALTRNTEEKAGIVQGLFREIHSLKGTAGILKLEPVAVFLHSYEDALGVLSHSIHRIVAVKKNEVFDFFLQSLDLIERMTSEFSSEPEKVLKDQKQLFSFYIRMILEAREIMENEEDYFTFEALNEDLF